MCRHCFIDYVFEHNWVPKKDRHLKAGDGSGNYDEDEDDAEDEPEDEPEDDAEDDAEDESEDEPEEKPEDRASRGGKKQLQMDDDGDVYGEVEDGETFDMAAFDSPTADLAVAVPSRASTPAIAPIGRHAPAPLRLFDVQLKDGFIVPPKTRDAYVIDELEELSRLQQKELSKQLWALVCIKARAACDQLIPGQDEETKERCQLYYEHAIRILQNYGITKDGAHVLRALSSSVDERGSPTWPPFFYGAEREGSFWFDLKVTGRNKLNPKAWYKQKNCPLTEDEKKNVSNEVKHLHLTIWIGQSILTKVNQVCLSTNNYVNKQYPKEFKSGETPSGTLQVIRKWYWDDVEGVARAKNNLRCNTNLDKTLTDEIAKYRANFQWNWYPGNYRIIITLRTLIISNNFFTVK